MKRKEGHDDAREAAWRTCAMVLWLSFLIIIFYLFNNLYIYIYKEDKISCDLLAENVGDIF